MPRTVKWCIVKRHGKVLTEGPVIVYDRGHFSAYNYGSANDPDWYVEFLDSKDGSYRYVKQKYDKVDVEVIDKPI